MDRPLKIPCTTQGPIRQNPVEEARDHTKGSCGKNQQAAPVRGFCSRKVLVCWAAGAPGVFRV